MLDTTSPPAQRVAIVGGGFSGAMVAVHLARLAPGPLDVTVYEPLPRLGCGVAYSATDPAHRINVPAARMTVFGDDPTQFDGWVRSGNTLRHDPAALWQDGSAFPQRGVFGAYIAGLVTHAQQARPDVTITHVQARVVDIAALESGYALLPEGGMRAKADIVVLAVSHPPPAVPAMLSPAVAAGAPILANPWVPAALEGIEPDAAVIVIGTGLTAADAVATLARRGHAGSILAISRRGLMSRGHVFGDIPRRNWFATCPAPRTAVGLNNAVRAEVRRAAAEGAPWQAVLDDVRVNAGRLWAALPEVERRRMVRHVRPYWDVHRFRVAPQVEASIAELREAGQFQCMAASILGADLVGKRVALRLRPRRTASVLTRLADAVIVTTGPAHGGALRVNPALASLARQGLVQADRVGLGLEVDKASHAVGRNGIARPDLLVAGPLARGFFGELMGLPQVSEHAQAVAAEISSLLEMTRHLTAALQPINQA